MGKELSPDLIAFLEKQKDRQEIIDCMLRYTRGVDRHDKAMMMSAYHPDAWDEHGVAEGDPEQFCAWAIGWHGEFQTKHQHIITNQTIEIEGNTAHSETYYLFWAENRQGRPQISFGRYIDRFEKRDGHWAIAHRVCVNELTVNVDAAPIPPEWADKVFSTEPSTRDKTDISYRRPLVRAG